MLSLKPLNQTLPPVCPPGFIEWLNYIHQTARSMNCLEPNEIKKHYSMNENLTLKIKTNGQ